jgi:hypothetical protein
VGLAVLPDKLDPLMKEGAEIGMGPSPKRLVQAEPSALD